MKIYQSDWQRCMTEKVFGKSAFQRHTEILHEKEERGRNVSVRTQNKQFGPVTFWTHVWVGGGIVYYNL